MLLKRKAKTELRALGLMIKLQLYWRRRRDRRNEAKRLKFKYAFHNFRECKAARKKVDKLKQNRLRFLQSAR